MKGHRTVAFSLTVPNEKSAGDSGDVVKVAWVAGWGINPDDLQARVVAAFPTLNHEVVLPGRIEPSWPRRFSVVVGWSWGAFRLLEWAIGQSDEFLATPRADSPRVLLIAPFTAFCSEAGQGGRCARTQVKWLRRWLKRDPAGALVDFYERAGLTQGGGKGSWVAPGPHSPHLAFWEQELETMESARLGSPGDFFPLAPKGIQSWIGLEDSLFDASLIASNLGAHPVPGASHNISDFFPFLTKELALI